jgi:hypothetical protein
MAKEAYHKQPGKEKGMSFTIIVLCCLVYFALPGVMRHPARAGGSEVTVQVVWNAQDGVEQIVAHFDTSGREPFRVALTSKINHFWGTFSKPDEFTFYRKSDGKIYTDETCADVRELTVLVLANDVVKKFPDKRDAFLKYGKR